MVNKEINKIMKNYRHGEIALVQIEKLPEGLKKSDGKELEKGSHGHSHSITKGEIYFKSDGEFVIGYLVALNTELTHPEHGKIKRGNLMYAKILDGIYDIRKQQEFVNEEMVPVID